MADRDRPERPLSPVERVETAIRHQVPDRIPRGEIVIDDGVIREALSCPGVGFEERLEFATFTMGLDILCLSPETPPPANGLPGPEEISWPDLEQWTARSGLFVFAVLDGPFGWGGRIFGHHRFLTLPLQDPGALREFTGAVERLNTDLAGRLLDKGIHGLILADDMAYGEGLLMGPRLTKEHFLPSLARQAEEILPRGRPLFFHSDGDIGEIIPGIADMGFHGLHCIDSKSGMDLDSVKAQYGERLCLWGTLTMDDLNRFSGPGDWEGVAGAIRESASGGGFILGTTSGIFKGLDWKALRAIHTLV